MVNINKNDLDAFFESNTQSVINYKEELNEEQYEAVTTTEGPVLIIAGAGSGKTHCLTYRILYLIEKGVMPEQILLLTFTNKASTEMMTRAINKLDKRCSNIQGGTYHSFCANILRKYGKNIGFDSDFLIKDSADAANMINYIKELNSLSKEKDFPKGNELISMFSTCINKDKTLEWILLNKYPKYIDYIEEIALVRNEYSKYKKERNILDYDDLLIYTNQLLRENDKIRKILSDTYKYIMVDEYQDSNKLQFEFISLLRSFENKNICVVGDDQQCVPEGTIISTTNGPKKVEDLTIADKIMVSSGNGNVTYSCPDEIFRKYFKGELYRIETKGGKIIEVTEDETIFAYKKKSTFLESNVDLLLFDAIDDDESFIHKMNISNNDILNRVLEKEICDVDEAIDFVESILDEPKYENIEIKKYAKILKECYHSFLEAKNLKEGMFICSFNEIENKIINDRIEKIEIIEYEGYVFDININFYRNYYANGICIHNCIYGFRGSNHKNILKFPEHFSPCKIIILNKNYRSSQEVLDFCNAIGELSVDRFDKTLVGTHSSGNKPSVIIAESENVVSHAILYDIVKRHESGTAYSDMAVLIRSSNDSNYLESLIAKESKRYNIPYKKFGGLKFMERAFVKDIFAFLNVLVNEKDEISWFVIFQMYLNIGPVYAKKLVEEMNKSGIDILINPKHKGKKYGQCLPAIHQLYKDLKTKDFSQQIEDIINIYYYDARKLSIDNMKTTSSVIKEKKNELDEEITEAQILIDMAKTYKTASDFLNDIKLDSGGKDENDNIDYLTISTVHSAKGLEFDTVYILNCVDNKFPWIKNPAADTEEAIEEAREEFEEEKRVFYVAATRAKENLLMFVPEYIFKYGKTEQATISSFLNKDTLKYCDKHRI